MNVKTSFLLTGVIVMVAGTAFGQGSAVIIKQRAKELRDQNNVRQGVASPAASGQAGTAAEAAAPARALTPHEQVLARLQAELAAIKPGSPASTPQQQQLAKDFLAAVEGTPKPSMTSLNKLARDLSGVLGDKLLATVTVKRLVQDLNAMLNPGDMSQARLEAVANDVQAIFQANNVERKDAVVIAEDAQAIAAEIKKAGAKPAA